MKKIFLVLVMSFLCLGLTGCGEKNVKGELTDIMESVYEEMYADVSEDERPMLATVNVLEKTEDMTDEEYSDFVKYYIGSDKLKVKEALASEPMMTSVAYSVVLVRMEKGADIEAAKTEIKENINPRKWMCVEVPEEDVIVKSKGDLIILIMVADEAARTKIETAFDNL